MALALNSDLAALVGFGCEAALWGINCALFIVSLVILSQRRLWNTLNNPVVYLNCFIFACCTTHFALEFSHFYSALSNTGVTGYSNETNGLFAADLLISFTDLLGDLVLIYRCWMLWGKNYYIVLIPFLASVAGFACIIGVINMLLAINPTSPAPPAAVVPLGLAGYVLPLCTNIIVTTLIVYRIWISSRTVPESTFQVGRGATRHAMALVIESGALYLLIQLIFVICFAISSPAEGILAVMAVQIYGIAPTLIIIRVGLGISSEQTTGSVMSTRIQWVARRVDDNPTSATNYTDGFATSTDMEGTKESTKHDPDHTELKVFDYAPSHRAEGIPSPV